MVGISAVLLTCLFTLLVSYTFFTASLKESLKNQCYSLAKSYTRISHTNFEDNLMALPDSVRATIISPDGAIVFETQMYTAENHADRPEVISALKNGNGDALRYSNTKKSTYYYFALQLSDGNVLRLSSKLSNVTSVFGSSLPVILFCIMLVFVAAFLLSSRLAKSLLLPISQAADELDAQNMSSVYDELAPFVRKIRQQNNEIRKQLDKLQYERDTINIITSHMQEGMILVSKERTILSVNPSAIRLLTSKNGDFSFSYNGKNILSISRIPQLDHCVNNALSGKSCDASFTNRGKICIIYANPVYDKTKISGAILIIRDETQQRLAENIRHEFSANVSHELKTPLTSILGYAEMLENGMAKNADDIQGFALRIGKESRRLLALIDDIIHLSRIEESGEKTMAPVDLYLLCENVIDSVSPIADKRNVSVHLTGIHLTITANPGMIEEMIYNLCENAIKYNKEDGTVEISVSRDKENAILTISDTGIGIPEDAQDRIFERFYRVDKSRSKQVGGTGLGLSIVKHIIEYHDGNVELTSQLGLGTTIKVYLPFLLH